LKRKYHLVKWEKIINPKRKGGLGIHDLRKLNQSLLCKWWWKLENKEGMWQKVAEKKYVKNNTITSLKFKATNSPVWKDLLRVKDIYLRGRRFKIGNGRSADFWRGRWCGSIALIAKFPELFDICNEQSGSVYEFAAKGWRLTFRRWLDERLQVQIRKLRDLTATALSQEPDSPCWIWEKSERFTVKSTYSHLCSDAVEEPNNQIWKAKAPLKIKIFMWLCQQNAILTKDNLSKKNWHGDQHCCFCQGGESIIHLFFDCPLARYVWSLVAYVVGASCRPNSFEQF